MRDNGSVTQREVFMLEGSMIVSTTDVNGKIKSVNNDFVDISGFIREELIGQPHNLIRHSDMPPEAFKDMWRDLKAGLPWSGYVKNRVKNGDHYWVHANAMPIQKGGHITGYMSVRNKPDADIIATVGAVYSKFLNGNAGSLSIEHGQIIDQSPKAKGIRWFGKTTNKIKTLTIALIAMLLTSTFVPMYLDYAGTEFSHTILDAFELTIVVLAISVGSILSKNAVRSFSLRSKHINDVLASIASGNYNTKVGGAEQVMIV